MSDISGISSALTPHHRPSHLLDKLFKQIDTDGNGTLSKTEMESAVTGAGGTTQSADALFSALDPNATGSIDQSQFVSGFSPIAFSPANGQQLIDAQAQGTDASSSQFTSQLFGTLDANGDGTLTKSELEQAVTAAGGTAASADDLFSQLDPQNTGSVTADQFAANFPRPGDRQFAQVSDSDSSSADSTSDSAQAAVSSLLQNLDPLKQVAQQLFGQLDGNADGSLTKSELEQAVTAKGGSTSQADTLYAELDPDNTGSVSEQQFTTFALAHTGPHGEHGGPPPVDALNDASTSSATTSIAQPTASTGNTAADAASALLNTFASSSGSLSAASAIDSLDAAIQSIFGTKMSSRVMSVLLENQNLQAAGA